MRCVRLRAKKRNGNQGLAVSLDLRLRSGCRRIQSQSKCNAGVGDKDGILAEDVFNTVATPNPLRVQTWLVLIRSRVLVSHRTFHLNKQTGVNKQS